MRIESESRKSGNSSDKAYLAFVDTAMALTAVLERLQETVKIGFTKRTIEDLAAPPSKRIIAGPERASPYVAWLSEQQQLTRVLMKGN